MKVPNHQNDLPKCNLLNIVEFILLDISDIVRYLGPTHPSLTSVLYHVICYSLYPGTIIAYPEEGEEWSSPHFSLKRFNLRKHFVHRHLLWRLLSLWKESEWWMGRGGRRDWAHYGSTRTILIFSFSHNPSFINFFSARDPLDPESPFTTSYMYNVHVRKIKHHQHISVQSKCH